ncbi:hypothetical protein ABZ819_00685 [Streptomyces venezuelae]|uniref:hypothetical protein n=1 Tax=Streptomyces venezuelae TaxID=54571 RepID=UPI0034433E99
MDPASISLIASALGAVAAIAPWVQKAITKQLKRQSLLNNSLEKWRRVASEDRNKDAVDE